MTCYQLFVYTIFSVADIHTFCENYPDFLQSSLNHRNAQGNVNYLILLVLLFFENKFSSKLAGVFGVNVCPN